MSLNLVSHMWPLLLVWCGVLAAHGEWFRERHMLCSMVCMLPLRGMLSACHPVHSGTALTRDIPIRFHGEQATRCISGHWRLASKFRPLLNCINVSAQISKTQTQECSYGASAPARHPEPRSRGPPMSLGLPKGHQPCFSCRMMPPSSSIRGGSSEPSCSPGGPQPPPCASLVAPSHSMPDPCMHKRFRFALRRE